MGTPKTSDGKPYVSLWPTEGSRFTTISHNWCDPTTWYTTAERIVDEEATDEGAHTIYALANAPIVDAYHGKISGEDDLLDADDHSFQITVKVNNLVKTEQDPHTASGGDFTVNYLTGKITFLSALDPSDEVLVTYHKVINSIWRLTPIPGTVLKISRVEAQFSTDVEIKDTVLFQPRGVVDYFAPQLVGNIPSGTVIPIGNPLKYKSLMDFINESNGNYAVIPAIGTNWRGTGQEIITFPWDYAALTRVPSSTLMDIELRLEHDEPFEGLVATASFYCLSESEV